MSMCGRPSASRAAYHTVHCSLQLEGDAHGGGNVGPDGRSSLNSRAAYHTILYIVAYNWRETPMAVAT
jgi:hypothetical protein